MFTKNRNLSFVRIALILAFVIGIHGFVQVKASSEGPSEVVPAVDFLNTDGTLKLDGSISGSFDLQGWDVQMDAKYGPVFSPINITTPAPLIGQWDSLGSSGAINSGVTSITINGNDVYVAGYFTNAGGIAEADYIAKWDGTRWSALGGNGAGDGAISGVVYAIAVSGSDIYIGGDFSSINNYGNIMNYGAVARWDGMNWSAVGNLNIGNYLSNGYIVRTIAVSGADVYVGGNFYDLYSNGVILADGVGLIKWDGSNWTTIGGVGAPNSITDMVIIGDDIYVGGDFINAGGIPEADSIAKWDGLNWSALGSNGAGEGALNKNVRAIAASGTNLYVGGLFSDAGGVPEADVIAKWDGTNWSALGSDGTGNGALDPSYMSVRSIFVDGTNVYVGGAIWNLNNNGVVLNTVTSIAKWDGVNWSGLGSDGADGSSLNSFVYAIGVVENTVYAGGNFYNVNNKGVVLTEVDNFAKWDGVDWTGVGKGNGSIFGDVHAIAVVGTDVYVGGCFEDVNNDPYSDYLVKWDGTNWSNLRTSNLLPTPINNCVSALATDGTNLYVGGAFQNANSIPSADYIARWDGTNWSALGSNGAGDGSITAPLGGVLTIAMAGTDAYIGGNFTDINNNGTVLTAADYIAKWDGTNWSALGSDAMGDGSLTTVEQSDEYYGSVGYVNSIAVDGSHLYAGGYFYNVRNGSSTLASGDYIVKWDGTNWSALGSNGTGDGAITDAVKALAVHGDDVYVGGNFINVGGIPEADYIAKWNGANWSALGDDGTGNGALKRLSPYFSPIKTIGVDGSNIYVGGHFVDVNNHGSVISPADYIAKWDGTNWSALSSNGAGDGSLNNSVNSIILNSTTMYVGGSFWNVNNNGEVINSADSVALYGYKSPIHYVKWNATGANKGSSWTDAYTDLQSALSAASSGDEIWVAAGTYKPTATTDRSVSFVLKNGVAIYGGFSGTEAFRTQRNFQTNVTVLSGEIGQAGISDNSYHVVVGSGTGSTAVLDGLTVTAGRANDAGGGIYNDSGTINLVNTSVSSNQVGGIYNAYGTINITDSIVSANSLRSGAGIYNFYGTLNITSSTFSSNSACTYCSGGGIYSYSGNVYIKSSTFSNNIAYDWGGGIDNYNGNLEIETSIFSNNQVTFYGGGAIKSSGPLSISDSAFYSNSGPDGGAIYQDSGLLTLKNSTVANNSASKSGGGIYANNGSSLDLRNNTISGNSAALLGGGLYNSSYNGPGGFKMVNTIIANSIAGSDCVSGSTISLNVNNLIEMNSASPNNCGTPVLTSDPLLGPLQNNGGLTQTMALLPGSPAINAGDDANCPATDQRGVTRPQGSQCDIGAYEYQSDVIPPTVLSVTRAGASPTSWASVSYTVTFSESVMGVDVGDFSLTVTGVTGASITGVSGSGTTRTVTVNTGSGNGTIRLDVVDNDSIMDAANHPLGGPGTGNGDFINGEVYTVQKSTATPGIPVLLSPASGSLVTTLQPKLDWKDSKPAAEYYQIQVSTNNTFTALVVDEINLSTSEFTFTSSLDPGKRYFWRVRGYNVANVPSGWSTVWNFRTPLAKPTLVSPSCGSTLSTDRPDFDWENVEGATQYIIQAAASNTFGTLLVNATVNASEYKLTKDLPQAKPIFWRVRAKNSLVTGPWSDECSFTTGNPPSVPVLQSPANNSTIKGYTPTLKWKAVTVPSGTTFDHYHLQLATDPDFSNLIADEELTSTQFMPPEELLPGVKYYWRVRAFNADDEYSAWTARWSFSTRANVFDNGVWWIKKLPPSSEEDAKQYPMDVYVNGVYWGKTHRLDFGHRKSAGNYPATAVIYNTGYVRLTPLGLPFGTSFILGPAHWDSNNKYFHNLQISRIDINTSAATPTGPLKITVTARDYNETLWPQYHFDVTHQITFPDPKPLKAMMSVTQTYTAATDFDLSAARQAGHEGFKLAQFSSMYINDLLHDSDGAQYTDINKDEHVVWFKDLLCDNLIFNAPLPLDNRNPWAQSFHSDNAGWQGNTPNTLIRLANPNLAAQFVPQGYWTCSSDENDDNLGLWINHESASSFSNGQVNSVSYTLISQDEPLPSAPGLVSPTEGVTAPTQRPTFEWKDVAWADKYNIQISTAANFSTLTRNITTTSLPYTLPTDLARNTKYFWRVRSMGSGGTSDWSDSGYFLTGRPPSVPALLSPANNALTRDYTPLFDWYNSSNPTGTTFKRYEIQVDEDNAFGSPEIQGTTAENLLSDSKFTPEAADALEPNTVYYWRVRAVNEVGGVEHFSAWSAVRSLRTALPPPSLTLPANLDTGVSRKPTFTWEAVSGATSYTIQVSTGSGFGTLLVNATTGNLFYQPVNNLPANKVIYWRVRANGGLGASAWSTFSFTTGP